MITVVPIFGWGWFDKDHRVEVPPSFSVDVTDTNDRTVRGKIYTGNYTGWTISLWARHQIWDGKVNAVLFDSEGNERVTGYADVPIEMLSL